MNATAQPNAAPCEQRPPTRPAGARLGGSARIGPWSVGVLVIATGMSIASCAATSSTSSTSSSRADRPKLSAAGTSQVVIARATKDKVGSVLVTSSGYTLYHLTTDTPTKTTCTGSCASLWPPLIATSGTTLRAARGLSGSLGTLVRPDGSRQIAYDGEPLYTYAQDTTPGDALGQGVGGVWFVASAAGAPGSSTTTTPTTSGHGGNGY